MLETLSLQRPALVSQAFMLLWKRTHTPSLCIKNKRIFTLRLRFLPRSTLRTPTSALSLSNPYHPIFPRTSEGDWSSHQTRKIYTPFLSNSQIQPSIHPTLNPSNLPPLSILSITPSTYLRPPPQMEVHDDTSDLAHKERSYKKLPEAQLHHPPTLPSICPYAPSSRREDHLWLLLVVRSRDIRSPKARRAELIFLSSLGEAGRQDLLAGNSILSGKRWRKGVVLTIMAPSQSITAANL